MQIGVIAVLLEVFAIVAVGGVGFSILRVLATRMTAVPVTELELKERTLTHSLGVREGGKLDVWMHPGARLPARVVRLVRGTTEPGRGLRLSLYAGVEGESTAVDGLVVRTFLGPLADDTQVFVEVTMRVAKDGGIRIKAVDKSTGAELKVTKARPPSQSSSVGRTTLRTRTLQHRAIDLDKDRT